MTKAIIYTRFSPRPNARDCDSCEKQEERCRLYCDNRGYEVVGYFPDRNVSGKTVNRPMLQVALGLLENGMVLVVDRNDRLARDMLVALTIHHEVESKGCTIEFADGSPLRCTPEGRLFQNILASFAQFEREKFSERTKSGLAKKKRDGVWCGRPPIGYRKVKGKDELEEDVKEQQAIRYIMRNCHHASNCIASDLNKYYLPCRKKPWSARTVRRIIAREKSKVSS